MARTKASATATTSSAASSALGVQRTTAAKTGAKKKDKTSNKSQPTISSTFARQIPSTPERPSRRLTRKTSCESDVSVDAASLPGSGTRIGVLRQSGNAIPMTASTASEASAGSMVPVVGDQVSAIGDADRSSVASASVTQQSGDVGGSRKSTMDTDRSNRKRKVITPRGCRTTIVQKKINIFNSSFWTSMKWQSDTAPADGQPSQSQKPARDARTIKFDPCPSSVHMLELFTQGALPSDRFDMDTPSGSGGQEIDDGHAKQPDPIHAHSDLCGYGRQLSYWFRHIYIYIYI